MLKLRAEVKEVNNLAHGSVPNSVRMHKKVFLKEKHLLSKTELAKYEVSYKVLVSIEKVIMKLWSLFF